MTANTFYLVQHGLAVDKQENPERPLSVDGQQQTRAVARQLHSTGVCIAAVFHSGKLRAQQTARIFAEPFALSESAIEGLTPGAPVNELIPRLTVEHALYVGHLPQLQKLTDTLLTGNEEVHLLQFTNSAVISLTRKSRDVNTGPSGNYQLAWYLPPDLRQNRERAGI